MSAIRVAMILPGLGRVQRGAETAFIEVGRALSKYSDIEIECFGSGDTLSNGLPLHNVGWMRRPGLHQPGYYERNRQRYQTALIPNGVDPTVFDLSSVMTADSIPQELRLSHEGPVILMVSALIASKRVDDAICSVAHVPGATLVVAGDGPEREKLSTLAQELIPGRHQFLGSIPAQKMPYIYAQADIFLHMSQIEPFGICYLEAASAGLPIVTHNGATQKWILGDTALFKNSSDHEGIARQLKKVLDPTAGRVLGEACQERVLKEWTWEVQGARYRDFIFDVMKENGREVPWRAEVDLP